MPVLLELRLHAFRVLHVLLCLTKKLSFGFSSGLLQYQIRQQSVQAVCQQCLSKVLILDGGCVDDDWENQWYNPLRPKRRRQFLRFNVDVNDGRCTKIIIFANVDDGDMPS